MYTLILIFAWVSGLGSATEAIHTQNIPGFASSAACMAAGTLVMQKPPHGKIQVSSYCVAMQ